MLSSTSGVTASRFVNNQFQHNGAVAAAFVGPCLASAVIIGGPRALACLLLGSLCAYGMDIMSYREAAFSLSFATVAATTVACWYALLTSDVHLSQVGMLIALLLFEHLQAILLSMWVTLQFQWIQLRHPVVAVFFERCLITAGSSISAVAQILCLSFVVPHGNLPYYLMLTLACQYFLLGRPLLSSFYRSPAAINSGGSSSSVHPSNLVGLSASGYRVRNAHGKWRSMDTGALFRAAQSYELMLVQSKTDGLVLALLTCFAPAAAYAAIYGVATCTSVPLHRESLVLLVSLPTLFLCLIPDGLWWIPVPPRGKGALKTMTRNALMLVSSVSATLTFESRVVFHAFSQYLHLPPPWDRLAVAFAMLGTVAAVTAITVATGRRRKGILGDPTLWGCVLLFSAAAGALSVGIPPVWMPAPLLAACGLALFLDTRRLREYVVFAGGASATVFWFLRQNFGFLDNVNIWDLSLSNFCRLALAGAIFPALVVPGLLLSSSATRLTKMLLAAAGQWPLSSKAGSRKAARLVVFLTDVFLIVQTVVVCFLEQKLYVAGQSEDANEGMYPAYLVFATSAAGIIAARTLAAQGRISRRLASWLVQSVCISKPVMLILPETQLLAPTILLVLTSTAPLFHHAAAQPTTRAVGAASDEESRQVSARRPGVSPVAPRWGFLRLVSIALAVALARYAVFDIVQYAVNSRPTGGLLLGSLVLVGAAACVPLVRRYYSTSAAARRALVATAAIGALLCVVQPPMPYVGGPRCPQLPLALCPRLWDERHIPLVTDDDVGVWGSALGRRNHWPSWLLIAAATLSAAAAVISAAVPAATTFQFSPCAPDFSGAPWYASAIEGAEAAAGRVLGAVPVSGLAAGGVGTGTSKRQKMAVGLESVAALVSGLLVGWYFSLELIPDQPALQMLSAMASCFCGLFVLLLVRMGTAAALHRPTRGRGAVVSRPAATGQEAHNLLLVPLFFWFLSAVLALALQADRELTRRRATGAEEVGAEELVAVSRTSLLAILACHCVIMAFTLRLKVGPGAASGSQETASGSGSGSRLREMTDGRRVLSAPGAQEPSFFWMWAPGVCNLQVAAALSLVAGAVASASGLDGFLAPPTAALTAPLLLLLTRDSRTLPLGWLSQQRRYCLPAVAVAVHLLASGAADIGSLAAMAFGSGGSRVESAPRKTLRVDDDNGLLVALEVFLALMALPSHVLFTRWLWRGGFSLDALTVSGEASSRPSISAAAAAGGTFFHISATGGGLNLTMDLDPRFVVWGITCAVMGGFPAALSASEGLRWLGGLGVAAGLLVCLETRRILRPSDKPKSDT